MTESEQKWIETNRDACAVLRQLHDMLALSSLPPRRTWVGLTEKEVEDYWDWEDFQCGAGRSTILEMVRHIEAKLKEKNNG
jgi:hypothetical protein